MLDPDTPTRPAADPVGNPTPPRELRKELSRSLLPFGVIAAAWLFIGLGAEPHPVDPPPTAATAPASSSMPDTASTPSPTDDASPTPATPGAATPEATGTAAPPTIPLAAATYDYRIRIPRLGIDLPVQEGDLQRDTVDGATPDGFAFHLPGTASPGQPGNTFIYAHARTGMFLTLWNARLGDQVIVRLTSGATLVYVVSEIMPRVAATDVSIAQPTASERLTLQTSTGPGADDPRFVVIALPFGD